MSAKTDTGTPDYYHKVVDCQWACPAHTNVPEYIRLIAQGKYTESYLLNRKSNVFPGILGRVCDRPCEPACRRGRVEDKPVAICRLKRVAADNRGDITAYLPPIPQQKNGKRIALIGSGPASLTVANDLLPLGYEVEVFEKEPRAGGAMRYSVPGFRLPEQVLDDEIDVILQRGAKVHFGKPVASMKQLLAEKFAAVFVGCGAPQGRDLDLPGRAEAKAQVQIGLEWLANIAFGHVDKVPPRVLVIGGGNTAMDCCRSALRLGAKDVKVVAPESYEQMLASPWEKEDAEHEGIQMVNHLLPQRFVLKDGKLVGVEFQHLKQLFDANKKWAPIPSGQANVTLDCDLVVLAIGQNTAFSFIERDCGIDFDKQDRPIVDPVTFQSSQPQVFFGGDAAFGPKNIIWAVAHGHEAAISLHQYCQGLDVKDRLPAGMNLISQKMGIHEWSYDNSYDTLVRQAVPHVALAERLRDLKLEVELGFDVEQAITEAKRCLNCDVQTVFTDKLCIECDACVDICPLSCLTIAQPATEDQYRQTGGLSAPVINPQQALLISQPLPTGRLMVKDEDLCIHCGLCAERCPTGAWDMQKFTLQLPQAKDVVRAGNK